VSSPLKRSLQTASLVATEMGFEQKIAIEPSLEPGGTLAQFEAMLEKYAGFENVLVVGHNPNLSLFVGSLVAMPPRTSRANLRMRKGSVARIDMSRRPRQLLSLIDPRMLQQIYASVAKSSRRKTSRK
jgi:phosphohistidine phosphatase